jgi:hypothetical protein
MANSTRRDARTANDTRRHADQRQSRDAGAFIGRLPERQAETIPGGIGPKDQRVSAVGTQPGPARGPAPAASEGSPPPEGHREATIDGNEARREGGQDR